MTAVIGELTWEGGAWVGVGKLPAWAGIDVCVSEDDARRQTPCAARPIGVRMVAPGAPGAPPSREQFAAYEVLLADDKGDRHRDLGGHLRELRPAARRVPA